MLWIAGGASIGLVNEVCSLYQLTGNDPPESLTPEWPDETTCDDNLDNDCDGFVDSLDPDCQQPEICDDDIDNDSDGLVDCNDPDCDQSLACMSCTPVGLEPNETVSTAYNLGVLVESGSVIPTGETGVSCTNSGGYLEYPYSQPSESDETAEYFVEVKPKVSAELCEPYTIEFSNGGPQGNVQTVTGNSVPDGDSDWYKVVAVDMLFPDEVPKYECVEWEEIRNCIAYDPDTGVCTKWGGVIGHRCLEYENIADMDRWSFGVRFIDNPGNHYGMNLYRGDPQGGGYQVCILNL